MPKLEYYHDNFQNYKRYNTNLDEIPAERTE